MQWLANLTNGISLYYRSGLIVASSPEIKEQFGCDTIPTPYMARNSKHALRVVLENYALTRITETVDDFDD